MNNRKTRVWSTLFVIVVLVWACPLVTGSSYSVPPPQQLPPTGNCYDDNIFYGAIPPGGTEAPVLVFVHGLSGLAEDWWSDNTSAGLNDMYVLAYNAGYRTAFVNLNVNLATPHDCSVVRRPANSVMDSAIVLGKQIETILQHYNVSQVDVIAHSKGGVDSQAAIVWADAWPHVRNVFTIASPHQGSILVDLLWSPEGIWLAALLGQLDDATFSLRTASMALFRSVTDSETVDDHIRYYSGAGNFWQTPGSLYERTGEWLQNHPQGGDNDGVVTVSSTYLLNATTLFIEPWNHNETYMGKNAFPYIHQVLLLKDTQVYLPLVLSSGVQTSGTSQAPIAEQLKTEADSVTDVSKSIESDHILRGGRLNGTVVEHISVEPQARAVRFSLLTSDQSVGATLSDPKGALYPLLFIPNQDQGVLGSAFLLERTVSQPSSGQWAVQINSSAEAGYLLIVTFDSQLRIDLDGLPNRPIWPGQTVLLTAHSLPGLAHIDQIKLQTVRAMPGSNGFILEDLAPGTGPVLSHTFMQEDVYGMSVVVYGRTTDGNPFERSFIHSQAVLSAEKLADDAAILAMLSTR